MGAVAAVHLQDTVEHPHPRMKWLAGVTILCLIILYFIWLSDHGTITTNHLYRLLFVASAWFILEFVNQYRIKWYMKMSFFIYCMHLMVLQCAQGVTKRFIGNALLGTTDYVLMPWLTLVVVIGIGCLLRNQFPKTWNILTGARG